MQNDVNIRAFDEIQAAIDRQYRKKKRANLIISTLIAVLGVSSFLYGLRLESIRTIFRWLTVDSAVFTTISAILCIAVNLVEVLRNMELTRRSVYYLRLSSAVAESVVFAVVLFSQLPFFSEHMPIFDRYDSFVMHLLIPLLGVESFLINDPPIGKLKPIQRWQGTWFVSYYAVNILTLFMFLSKSNELSRVVALGHVVVTNAQRSGACAMATYRRRRGEIEMFGDGKGALARLVDGGEDASVLEGERIKFWVDAEQVEVDCSRISVEQRKGAAGT